MTMTHMPEFENEADYNKWMSEQSKKIPRNHDGIPTFKNTKHFMDTLTELGIENVQQISKSTIIGKIK